MAQVTRLWPYGGPGHQYGSFAGKTEQIIVDVPATSTGGAGSSRRKYPRRILVDGRVIRVKSAYEERELLQALHDRAREALKAAQAADTVAEAKQARKRVKIIERRLEAVAPESDRWLAQLRKADEELLMMVLM